MILHAHQFKNAGSTLDWSLQRNFGDAFIDHRDDAALRDNPQALATLVAENPDVRALSSHWLPLPLLPELNARSTLLVLLRHPVDRARSVYHFERRQSGAHGPSSEKAKTLGFRDFVTWRLEQGRGPVIRNYQVRYLSGEFLAEDVERLLPLAKAQLEDAVFGIVERYEESMIVFERALAGDFPAIDLAAPPQNVSRDGESTLEQRLDDIREEMGDIYDQLLAQNREDLALYAWALEQFSRRLSMVDELDSRLADYQTRTQGLL